MFGKTNRHFPPSQEHNSTYTQYTHRKQKAQNFNELSNDNCIILLPRDPFKERFSKRMNYKFPPSKRVIDSSLLNQEKRLMRNMSANTSHNNTTNTNGAWNSFMNKTNNESSLTGKTRQRNPKTYQSQVFGTELQKEKEKRHSKIGQFTDQGQTTQIYHLPGGVKRSQNQITDDSRIIPSKPHFATIIKHNKDFGPLFVPCDSINNKTVNAYLGTYATRYRNESHVLVSGSKNYPDAFELYKGKRCNVNCPSEKNIMQSFGIESGKEKFNHKKREPPIENNQFRSQIVIN